MKRTPLKAGKPLARRTPLRARTTLKVKAPTPSAPRSLPKAAALDRKPMRAKKSKRVSAFDAEFERVKVVVRARSKGYCEGAVSGICTGVGQHFHHRKRRGPGGNEPGNVIHLCSACHNFAHHNRVDAERLGLIIPTWKESA